MMKMTTTSLLLKHFQRSLSEHPPPERSTDESLVLAHLKGSTEAFEHLVRRYQTRLVTFLTRYTRNQADAEELAQEAFLKFYRALPRLALDQAVRPYLYKIAVNTAHDWARREKINPDCDELSEELIGEEDSAVVEDNISLEAALMRLSPAYREVIGLRYISNLPYHEIAQVLTVPEETVRTRLRRALAQLRKLMGRTDNG
jgi:RNA polymerase sigma-70 factor (ECF subfamily)